MSENKRFEEWVKVDCNECARYWDSSCDGVNEGINSDKALTGSRRLCNSFLPTRSVVLPEKIKLLEKRVDRLTIVVGGLFGGFLVHLVLHILEVF